MMAILRFTSCPARHHILGLKYLRIATRGLPSCQRDLPQALKKQRKNASNRTHTAKRCAEAHQSNLLWDSNQPSTRHSEAPTLHISVLRLVDRLLSVKGLVCLHHTRLRRVCEAR